MPTIELIRRFGDSNVVFSQAAFRENLIGVKGIRPQLCPAIKDFSTRGWRISTPVSVDFIDEKTFLVKKYKHKSTEDLMLVPGVIGDKNSKKMYARIDTGFSTIDLKVPFLAIKCQDENDLYCNFEIAPVIYPLGYTGPILAACYANSRFALPINTPIIHCIPLNASDAHVKVADDFSLKHCGFEGLFFENWKDDFSSHTMLLSTQIILQ